MCTTDERGLEVIKKENIPKEPDIEFGDFVFFALVLIGLIGVYFLE
jgi:hypothetical protein